MANGERSEDLCTTPPSPDISSIPPGARSWPTPSRPGLIPFSPEFLARFRPVRLLGQGAMGAVYLMVQTSLEREVAVKVLRHDSLSPVALARLTREARILGRLRHPNILSIHDVGSDRSLPYMVCEYVPGETLAQRLARGPLATQVAVEMARRILDGLEAAHVQGVIHRDLKPSNLLLNPRGAPIIGDFGLAKSHDSPSDTGPGRILGTPAYMSPEQCRGLTTTAASDLYAMGVILFEMLTGARPFPGPELADLVTQHTTEDAPSLWTRCPHLPHVLEEAVRRALAKRPADRFANALEMRDALAEL